MTNVSVTDNRLPANQINCGGDTNVIALLAAGDSHNCIALGVAETGSYENTGHVTGKPPYGENVTDEDDSNYFAWASGQITPTDTSCEKVFVAALPDGQLPLWHLQVRLPVADHRCLRRFHA